MPVTLNANALITATELATMTGKTFATDYANTLINFASDFIEIYCDRKFVETTYTDEYYDGNGDKIMYLDNGPMVSVTTVKSWDTYNNVALYTFTEHTEYIVYLDMGYIYLRSIWTEGQKNYRITYKAGYTTSNMPYDLRIACSKLCDWYDNNKANNGISSETIGRYSISYGGAYNSVFINGMALPADILSILADYRIVSI